jgi:hypothetical protein
MGSPFDAAARAADAVQVCVFGEPVQILPQAARNRHGLGAADNTRPARTVVGVFTKAPDSEPLEGTRRGGDPRGFTAFSGYETRLWLSAEIYASLGYSLRKDDIIVLTDRAGQRWQIAKAGPATDAGDITLALTDESEAA